VDRWRFLRAFYARRALRILPVYAIALGLGLAFSFPGFWEYLLFHIGFATNYVRDQQALGATTHFWSLSVEEQFYTVVPWLLLFVPRRVVLPVIVSLIVVGLGSVWHRTFTSGLPWWFDRTTSSLITLGLGVLLAYVQSEGAAPRSRTMLLKTSLCGGWPLLLFCEAWVYLRHAARGGG
jgi:peptidoglycan/LPS O-acetylase OafA/YrhL